jgi:hypothetical protein
MYMESLRETGVGGVIYRMSSLTNLYTPVARPFPLKIGIFKLIDSRMATLRLALSS